jgi:hypothetical protein
MSEILHQLNMLLGVGTYHLYPAQGKRKTVSSNMSALSWELSTNNSEILICYGLKTKRNYIKREKQRNLDQQELTGFDLKLSRPLTM